MIITDLDKYKTRPVDAGYPAGVRTFYAPVDDVHGALVHMLQNVQHSLILAMYGYADDELAALVADLLSNPRIYCQITLDKSQAGGVHERAILEKYKAQMGSNSVAIGTSERSAIMHRKMMIVDGIWRISGSTNWSLDGETKQDNELTVMRHAVACAEARYFLDLEHSKALTQMEAARNGKL